MIAAYASLGRARSELVLLALAIGLALTTKFTGILALPVLALVAAVGNPIRRWPALAGVGLAGIVLGAPWYIVNRLETGHFDGALTSATAQVQERTLIAIAPTIRRELYSLVDFSGTRGIDLYPSPPSPFTTLEEIFGLLGLLALVVGGAWGIGAGRTRCGLALGAGAALVVVLPAALVVVGDQFLRVWHEFWLVVGRPAIAEADSSWQWQLSADPALSWFGPLAASLLIVGTAIVARETWRRQFTPVAVVLAAAPLRRGLFHPRPVGSLAGTVLRLLDRTRSSYMGCDRAVSPGTLGAVVLAGFTLPLALLGMSTKPVASWARETTTQAPLSSGRPRRATCFRTSQEATT